MRACDLCSELKQAHARNLRSIVGDLNYSTTQLQLTPALFCALCRTAQPAHMSDASTDALMSNTNADI